MTLLSVENRKARRLKTALFAHIAAVTCCAAVADIDNGSGAQCGINMLFTALVGSDLCLLGLTTAAIVEWPTRRRRILLLLTGVGWVWLLCVFIMVRARSYSPPFLFLLPGFVTVAAFGFGVAMRVRGIALAVNSRALGGASEPLQFTLRRLLQWVAATATLLAIAKALHSTASLHLERGIAYTIAMLGVMSLLAAGIVLATMWATLGSGRPVRRLPFAFFLAVAGGLTPAYCFDRPSPWAYVLIAITAAMLSAIAGATLLVVRDCGYRLVGAANGR